MILVGITGSIGHGKTTFAQYLGEAASSHWHIESSDIIIEIANRLRFNEIQPHMPKEGAMELWLHDLPKWLQEYAHFDANEVDLGISVRDSVTRPEEYEKLFSYRHLVVTGLLTQNEPIIASTKEAHRPLLQWLGGYLAKHASSTLWYDEIRRRAQERHVEIVTAGGLRFPDDGYAIRRHNPSYIISIERPEASITDAMDLTERERSEIDIDCRIINDGSLEQLEAIAHQVHDDMLHERLALQYQTSISTS